MYDHNDLKTVLDHGEDQIGAEGEGLESQSPEIHLNILINGLKHAAAQTTSGFWYMRTACKKDDNLKLGIWINKDNFPIEIDDEEIHRKLCEDAKITPEKLRYLHKDTITNSPGGRALTGRTPNGTKLHRDQTLGPFDVLSNRREAEIASNY